MLFSRKKKTSSASAASAPAAEEPPAPLQAPPKSKGTGTSEALLAGVYVGDAQAASLDSTASAGMQLARGEILDAMMAPASVIVDAERQGIHGFGVRWTVEGEQVIVADIEADGSFGTSSAGRVSVGDALVKLMDLATSPETVHDIPPDVAHLERTLAQMTKNAKFGIVPKPPLLQPLTLAEEAAHEAFLAGLADAQRAKLMEAIEADEGPTKRVAM